MSTKISDIEGIGPSFSKKIAKAGIKSVAGLLKKCADKKGRKQVSEITGIDESQILKWTNMADLYRVKGIGSEYAELLKASGVDTVKELRNRNAENLHQKIIELNNEKHLVRLVPGPNTLKKFIETAGNLDPVITH